MSPTERKAMIRKDRTDLSLTKQCKLLKISRSSLYYVPVGVNAETLELMNEIDRVFTKYQQETPRTSCLPIPAEEVANHAAKPCLVQRYYLHSSAPWLSLSGRDHGLGDAQGAGMAALEHAGRQLLCRRLK
jgi:hypothetical protein